MKSLCIKTNNSKSIYYLLNEFKNLDIEDTYFSCKSFKHYNNVIIHYLGNDLENFYSAIANLLAYLVIDNFEDDMLKKIILGNYFYFDYAEINSVLEICENLLCTSSDFSSKDRYMILFNKFYEYISSNKKLYLNGFLNFQNKDYLSYLEEIVNTAVNNFIIEREYSEFISLLKIYINSHDSSIDFVQLYYNNSNPMLYDESNNLIDVKDDSFDLKYISDISFSSNDYILNALLTLMPKRIIIHICDSSIDEFINTLSLIFENRVTVCK